MKKAFVFDMDGVIVDSEKYYHHQRMTFMKQEGLTPGVSDIDPYVVPLLIKVGSCWYQMKDYE